MSLSNTDVKDTYSGNGSTIYFPYTFTLPSSSTGSEVAVYITDSNGVTGDKLTTGYTVDLDNQRVIYPDPYDEEGILPSGYKITLIRETPKTQLAVFTGQSFNPKSFERSLDKAVMMIQEMNDKVERAVIANVTSNVNYSLPEAEAEKVLGWNADGDGLINYDNPGAAVIAAEASATAAALSESNAAASETEAQNQVTLATTQATNAANSATEAAEAALEAEVTSKNWKASLTYAVGNICYPTSVVSNLRLECIVAGTSGTTEPTWTAVGTLVTDNEVTWKVHDTRNDYPSPGGYSNLVVTNTSTTITLSAGSIGLRNSAGTRSITLYDLSGITLTPTLAASTAYYLWLVHTASTNTTAMVLTTTYTAPGYDYYRYLGGRFTDSSSRLYYIKQVGNKSQYIVDGTVLTSLKTITSGIAPSNTATSINGFVPSTAASIFGIAELKTAQSYLTLAPNQNYITVMPVYIATGTSDYQNREFIFVIETTNLYYYCTGSTGIIVCLGWEENL